MMDGIPQPSDFDLTPKAHLSVFGIVIAFVCAAGMAAAITLLYNAMAEIMVTAGGFVASGGPYVIAHQAPSWTWWIPGCALAFFLFAGISMATSSRGWGISLTLLAWMALFIALGWNFLRLGLNPPPIMKDASAWVVCGVLFWAMGFWPALLLIPPVRAWYRHLLAMQTPDAQRFWQLPEPSRTSPAYLVAQALGALSGVAAGIAVFALVAG